MLSSTQALDIVCAQVPDLPQRIQALILPAERSADMARRERGFTRVLVAASARDEHAGLVCRQAEPIKIPAAGRAATKRNVRVSSENKTPF